jgi:hypothetical protein
MRPQFSSVLAMLLEMGRSLVRPMKYAQVDENVNCLAAWKSIRTDCCAAQWQMPPRRESEAREIRTPNLLIWNQTRCRCAIAPYDCTTPGRHRREWAKLLTCEPVADLL